MKILILSDIHANLPALDAVLKHEEHWDEVFFLGDAISEGPQPEEVLTRLSQLNGIWILGNHDLEPFINEFLNSDPNPDHRYMKWTREQISLKNRQFLESFEKTVVVERDGLKIRLVHGDFPIRPVEKLIWSKHTPQPIRWLARAFRKLFLPPWASRFWPDTPSRIFASLARKFPEPYVFFAHTHVQFCLEVEGTTFVNPGSVGQPRLGKPMASYAVLEKGKIDLRTVPYNTEAVCKALDGVPLEKEFIEDWKSAYRSGNVPERYKIRSWKELIDAGYH